MSLRWCWAPLALGLPLWLEGQVNVWVDRRGVIVMSVVQFPANPDPRADVAVLGRNELFAALRVAVQSDSARSVLVIVGFEGMTAYRESRSDHDGDALMAALGNTLLSLMGDAGVVFASRRDEFCVLCEGGLASVRSLLVVVPSELDELARPYGVRTSLGIAVLPDEATVPTFALALADRRMRALSGNLRGERP